MSSFLSCASHVLANKAKAGEFLSDKKRQKIYDRITHMASEWEQGYKYVNTRDAQYNTFEQFERIYVEATGLPFDPNSVIPHLKDLRKFEIRLKEFDVGLATTDGAIMSNLKLPRRILKSLPETAQFTDELVSETGYFRRENVDNNKRVNDILHNFKKFSGSLGGDATEYSRLEALIEPLLQNKEAGKKYNKNLYQELRRRKLNLLAEGSGKANIIFSEMLQGKDIPFLRRQYNLSAYDQSLLNNMKREYSEIRKSTSVNLIRGLQKIININKDSNVKGMDKLIDDVKNRIKQIEFQKVVDENDNTIKDLDYFIADEQMQKFGFTEGSKYALKEGRNYKIANRQYMPQYVLGIPKILSQMERAVRNEPIKGETIESLISNIDKEINGVGGLGDIINRVKSRSTADSEYSVDPFLFLNKYVGEVSLFNYKIHIKDSFKRLTDTMVQEHLKPAQASKNELVQESLEHHLRIAADVYNTVQKLDSGDTTLMDNTMRTLSSLTYFRLLGGNARSALRNGTQRIYEFHKYGYKGIKEAKEFYTDAGGTENLELANGQAKRFGLLWFDNKGLGKSIIDAWKGKGDISSASRGALQESFFTNKGLEVNSQGEIVRSTDGFSDIVARGASNISDKASFAHKVIENWNRTKTFQTGFAVALRNLRNMSPEWISRQSGIKMESSGSSEKISKWMANEAGQIAFNTVTDLHYEYANWAKAKILRSGKGVKGRAGQFFGQFLHYRFSNFDMMADWIDKGMVSMKAGDFTSNEVFTVMRLGIAHSLINNIFAPATNIRTDSLLNNDTVETIDKAYTWFTTDRNDPEQVKKLEKKTYGQGGYYFLGPNVGFLLSLAEVKNFRDMDKDIDYRDDIQHIDDRTKQFKALSLINSQLARFYTYTLPLAYERGMIDAGRLEAGILPNQEIRDIRDSAKKWVGRNLYPRFKMDWMKYKSPKRKQPKPNPDAALQALSLLS